MQVEIKKAVSYEEEKAIVQAVEITEDIQSAIDILENNCRVIPVITESGTAMCKTDRIYYIESIDKRSYVYTKDACFESKARLYEMEEMLGLNFFRSSKAMIINIRKIQSVKADVNGRMIADLLNGEQVIISRGYVKDLKRKLGL